jgi:cobalt-zinc-cadmium efflux system membrane fusion protein
MYMNAEVALKASANNTLPEESIVSFEGKDFVFIQKSKLHYEMVEVLTGEKDAGFIALKNPDKLMGKAIVTKGAYTLLMKLKNKEE